jgi:hypothetical protein
MSHLRTLLATGLLVGAPAGSASAAVYNFTGSNFTQIYGPPYTTSDHVIGSITLTAPLAHQRPLSSVYGMVHDLTFDDGHQIRSWVSGQAFPDTFLCDIQLGTDLNGNINAWSIWLRETPVNQGDLQYDLELYSNNPNSPNLHALVGQGHASNVVCGQIVLTTGAARFNAADVAPWEALPDGLIFRNGFEQPSQ